MPRICPIRRNLRGCSRNAGWGWKPGRLLMRHLRAVSTEVRLSGSPEEARAFDYIEHELKGWGYDVRRYSLDAYTGYPERAWLKMILPEQIDFHANGYSLSPGTSPEGVEVGEYTSVSGRIEARRSCGVLASGRLHPSGDGCLVR